MRAIKQGRSTAHQLRNMAEGTGHAHGPARNNPRRNRAQRPPPTARATTARAAGRNRSGSLPPPLLVHLPLGRRAAAAGRRSATALTATLTGHKMRCVCAHATEWRCVSPLYTAHVRRRRQLTAPQSKSAMGERAIAQQQQSAAAGATPSWHCTSVQCCRRCAPGTSSSYGSGNGPGSPPCDWLI
jgi:hypothetical protein